MVVAKRRLLWILADPFGPQQSCHVDTTRRFNDVAVKVTLGMAMVALWATLAVAQNPDHDADRPDSQASAVALRGTGQNREMLIRGRVFGTDGLSAQGYELLVNLKESPSGLHELSTMMEGSRFEVWVPVGGSGWSYLEVSASADGGRRRAFLGVPNWSLRQKAIDGIELRLAPTSRNVEVSVVKDGVPVEKAHVTCQLEGNLLLHAESDEDGRAVFHLMDGEGISRLSAWTDQFEVGGYQFNRQPRRDTRGGKFTIELDDCRDQRIRFVDVEINAPVADVRFALTVGTGPPNYNFPGTPDTLPGCRMTTDEKGEATYRLFPNWKEHGSYVEIIDRRWAKASSNKMTAASDGALVVEVKRRIERKPMVGRVESVDSGVGGFLLVIQTFQAEEEGYVDRLYAVTDGEGHFTVDCLPGATYCVCVADERHASEIIDLIPFEPATGESKTVLLQAMLGHPVEIRLTSGPNRQPIPGQHVNFRTSHDFSWLEDSEPRHGSSGRQWGVSTDDMGIARTWALAGSEVEANVYAGEWRSGEKRVTVSADQVATIEFHREVSTAREVKGHLVPPPDLDVDLAGAEVFFGSVDGETDERHTGRTDAQGRFAFTTKAIRFGVFAYTADGKAAGVATSEKAKEPLDVQLSRTASLQGRLLLPDESPLGHHAVRVRPQVRGQKDRNKSFSSSFLAKTFETTTDSEGDYAFEKLPSQLDMSLQADPIDNAQYDVRLDRFFLQAGESRTGMVSHIGDRRRRDDRPVAEKYDGLSRDSLLGDFHLIVFVYGTKTSDFVDAVLDNSRTQLGSYLQLLVRADELTAADSEFVTEHNWLRSNEHSVFASVLSGSGQELGRIELNVMADGAAAAAAGFLHTHAPPIADAEEKWAGAFAEAKITNRRVWARVSQRYCGPCFRMARWLDDNRESLERDYVLLKVDNVRDIHGPEVADRIVSRREQFGVPFHAIFDADEELMIDSEGPTGNIGHPASFEGRRHLKTMLSETRSRLSDEQIDQIIDTLRR